MIPLGGLPFSEAGGWGGEEGRKEKLYREEGRESLVVLFKKGWTVQIILGEHCVGKVNFN